MTNKNDSENRTTDLSDVFSLSSTNWFACTRCFSLSRLTLERSFETRPTGAMIMVKLFACDAKDQ